jgi:hypothetical protein
MSCHSAAGHRPRAHWLQARNIMFRFISFYNTIPIMDVAVKPPFTVSVEAVDLNTRLMSILNWGNLTLRLTWGD